MKPAGWLMLIAVGLMACSAALSRRETQFAAINAGCETALDLERDAGFAGAENDTERGCTAALWTLDPKRPPRNDDGAAGAP